MHRLWLCRRSMSRLMSYFLPRFLFCLAALGAAAAFASSLPAHASDPFPFGDELMLDAAPMHGSRRVPMIEIDDDGTASIDLWCGSLKAQVTVNDSAITIVPGTAAPAQCDPDREARDADLLTALTQVTGWHRSGQVIELTGATPLRFRLMTN